MPKTSLFACLVLLPVFVTASGETEQHNPPPTGPLAKYGDSPGMVEGTFQCTWTAAAVIPIPILETPLVSVGGYIYTFAGVSNGVAVATSFKFDGTTWTTIAPLPTAVQGPAAVTNGTDIFILGGGQEAAQTTLYRYNVATNTYTALAPFTTGTWSHAAVYLNGKIFKFGGIANGGSSVTSVLEIYDVASNTWTLGAPYPTNKYSLGAFAQGNFIYAAGGADFDTLSAKTYRYDPTANTWDDAAIADLPEGRTGAASGFYNGGGVLAGGYTGGSGISNAALFWDPGTNTWSPLPNMFGERVQISGAVLNGSFYVVGGRSNASPSYVGTNDNQTLTCVFATPTPTPAPGSNVVQIGRRFPGAPSFLFDSDAAVGLRHFVELTNVSFRVYYKNTGTLVFSAANLFGSKMNLPNGHLALDQHIRFDHSSQRWIAIGIGYTSTPLGSFPRGFMIGVSATDDPAGEWRGLFLNASADPAFPTFVDYPFVGVDGVAVYISAVMFPFGSTQGVGGIFSIPKTDLLSVAPTGVNVSRLIPKEKYPRWYLPQMDYKGTSADGVLASFFTIMGPNHFEAGIWKRTIMGAQGPGALLSDLTTVDVSATFAVNQTQNNAQPGTTQQLGVNFGAQPSVRVGKYLYTAWTYYGGIVWLKIDAEANAGIQGGIIGDPDSVVMAPSICANERGDVVIAYTRCGPAEFASGYASVGHLWTDGQLTFDPPLLLKAGSDIYDEFGPGPGRFSDFGNSVTVDPVDSSHFWISSHYIGGRNVGSTYVTELIVPSATARTTLANISTRLPVQTEDNVLIGGFIITGTQPKKVIIRAIGPSLGVTDKLANPTLAN